MSFDFSPFPEIVCPRNVFPSANRLIYLDPLTRILLVTSELTSIRDCDVIGLVAALPGYEAHKFVQHRGYCQPLPFHLYVRFTTQKHAYDAKCSLIKFKGLQIRLVSTCLQSLFQLQLELNFRFMWTAAYVDQKVQDFNKRTLGAILPKYLADYGNPKIIFSISNKHHDMRVDLAYISFPSPAEALGACIRFGQWFRFTVTNGHTELIDNHFRILLHKGPHFSHLLNLTSEEYLDLGYFYHDGDWDTDNQCPGYGLMPVYAWNYAENQQYSPDINDPGHLAPVEQSLSPEVEDSSEEFNNGDSEQTECQPYDYSTHNYDIYTSQIVSAISDLRAEWINQSEDNRRSNTNGNQNGRGDNRRSNTNGNQNGRGGGNGQFRSRNNNRNINSKSSRTYSAGNSRNQNRNEGNNRGRGSSKRGSRGHPRQTPKPKKQ